MIEIGSGAAVRCGIQYFGGDRDYSTVLHERSTEQFYEWNGIGTDTIDSTLRRTLSPEGRRTETKG